MAEIETPALTAWYEHRDLGQYDRPEVTVRFMQRAPHATLVTYTRGADDGEALGSRVDYLPEPDRPFATLDMAGVMFHAPLADLEWYVDAARDALRVLRAMAVGLGAPPAAEVHGEVR